MVEEHEISRPLHCPNQEACPGGLLPPAENGKRPMCAKGYVGRGCTSCAEEFARADSSILACTACEENPRKQLLRWVVFLGQRTFLFVLSAMSALGARSADEVKQSGVYLNQLMAFATVSMMMLTAAMQTDTAKDMQSSAVMFVFGTTLAVAEIGSGGGAGGASSQCLLAYIGLRKTLWGAHLLDVAVAAALTSALALKDSRVALVAGLNCFLPNILASFGKYLVCYRFEPDLGGGLRGLQCPFLPEGPRAMGVLQVFLGLATCFSVALWAWVSLSLSKEVPPPPHVNFLASKYQPLYALFETERLVRKSLLMLIAAALPITASPALQMGEVAEVKASFLAVLLVLLLLICALGVLELVDQKFRFEPLYANYEEVTESCSPIFGMPEALRLGGIVSYFTQEGGSVGLSSLWPRIANATRANHQAFATLAGVPYKQITWGHRRCGKMRAVAEALKCIPPGAWLFFIDADAAFRAQTEPCTARDPLSPAPMHCDALPWHENGTDGRGLGTARCATAVKAMASFHATIFRDRHRDPSLLNLASCYGFRVKGYRDVLFWVRGSGILVEFMVSGLGFRIVEEL
ncbi:pmpB [Symbiodinium sp. CCMP2592]|nr:pmpB [Symbiodinium sp. CCMP2592]